MRDTDCARTFDWHPAAISALDTVTRVLPMDPEGELQVLELKAPQDPRAAVAALAAEKSWSLHALERVQPSLEEAFLAVVGAEGR